MTRIVLFSGGFDPWHTPDETGLSKTGYVTSAGTVIHPRLSRIAHTPLTKIVKRSHRLINVPHPRSAQIEEFFTNNVISNKLYIRALLEMGNVNSTFWNNPIKCPVLTLITAEEHEVRWNRMAGLLQKGDGIFTFDTKSLTSRVVAYLDQGTWSHVGTYSGNGKICEAITSGVVERSIEAYHNTRYRLGAYRLVRASSQELDSVVESARSQVGKRYNFRGVLRLGMRLTFGVWPANVRRDITPNMMIPIMGYELIAFV